MERSRESITDYESFLRLVRSLARLEMTVDTMFGVATPKHVMLDARLEDAWNSYLRLRSRSNFSESKIVDEVKLEIHDAILDSVHVPDEYVRYMDWEDFSELVQAVIQIAWERVNSETDDTMPSILSAI